MRELIMTGDQATAAQARRFAAGCMAEARVAPGPSFEMLLALNEAVTNACRHAYARDEGGDIRVSCGLIGDTFVMSVSDQGRGFDPADEMFDSPGPWSNGGRGLFLLKELMDDVEIHTDRLGTTVTLRRNVKSRCGANDDADNDDADNDDATR